MALQLNQLEAWFLRYEERFEEGTFVDNGVERKERRNSCYLVKVAMLCDAQAIFFLCPKCYETNNGSIGTHGVIVTFRGRGVPDHLGSHNAEKKPTRWDVVGTSIDDLTCIPSIQLIDGCKWHGFIRGGLIVNA